MRVDLECPPWHLDEGRLKLTQEGFCLAMGINTVWTAVTSFKGETPVASLRCNLIYLQNGFELPSSSAVTRVLLM